LSRGAWVSESEPILLGWDELGPLRLGLWTAIARPERVLRALERHGIVPRRTVFGGDHYPTKALQGRRAVSRLRSLDLWLTTAKCASHLVRAPTVLAPPICGAICGETASVAVLDHALCLGSALKERLQRVC
jgi:tetraacyldisaccharide-1-P 4'-kinase